LNDVKTAGDFAFKRKEKREREREKEKERERDTVKGRKKEGGR
jgi:hypothetical protein